MSANSVAFVRVPASKLSLSRRKLVHGVGVNDSDYIGSNNGVMCPIYKVWAHMLGRCYDTRYQAKQPAYIGCSTVSEWHSFNNFRLWVETQDWQGKQLDKDILIQGNKIYGPSACLFVTSAINKLLTDSAASRGDYPVGINITISGRFQARCSVNGKSKCIGTYRTAEEASGAYLSFKRELVQSTALEQVEPLRSALLRYKIG